MPEPWPKLSETLAGPRHPRQCQGCGVADDATIYTLRRWREHDEADKPTPVVVVLCEVCATRLVEPHPRLYSPLAHHAPAPGCMPICVDCTQRRGVACPLAKAQGGPGIILTLPAPTQIHLCRSPRQLPGWQTLWHGPVSACSRRLTAGTCEEH